MADENIREGLTEKERQRLERIDKLDENKRRKKVIFAAVTVVLILFFVLGTVFGGMYILQYEGTQEIPKEVAVYPSLPETPQDIYVELLSLTDDTKQYAGTKADVSFDVSIPEDSIVLSGENADAVMQYLKHVRSSAESMLSACYEDQRHTGAYGEDFSDLLTFVSFDADDAVGIDAVVNEENENDLKYVFTFDGCAFDDRENAPVFAAFDLAVAEQVVAEMQERFATVATVGDAELTYESFVLTAEIDRQEELLNNASQKRICKVRLPLTFIGEWTQFGTLTLEMNIELQKDCRFTRVSFTFNDDVYYIEKGSSDELKTRVVSDESPVDVKIEWISSDPSILSIDGNFYKGEKVSADPVTVTGTYTYNGITYTDSCLFYVRVPVEGCKVNTQELALQVGHSSSLAAEISPSDATLTKVYWFTSDADIATVDENGLVTAVASGETTVYCITIDGNYKSVCTVTVTE